ncbi:MAG: VWA domain-containing protein [Candidatus Hydrogenedentes bacterium]|nr:VWA domain-containing protein [Candidatus Hydrogenedentota bacterium]
MYMIHVVPALLVAAGTLLFSGPALAEDRGIAPGGCVIVTDPDGNPQGQCPLEHTDVQVDIAGFLARVTLTQRFGNPFTEPIEAVYTFPMSDRAAVDSMTMKVGSRVITGLIKEREEAQRIYQQARDAGQRASLLDQERPNIFTQAVANIQPGETIEITISYVEYLKYETGEYEFSFPMVVGPRYIPGGPQPLPVEPMDQDAGGVKSETFPRPIRRPDPVPQPQGPDAGRITPPVTPEGTRAGHDISLTVNLDAGLAIRDIESVQHEVQVDTESPSRAVVRLANRKEIPNRDFILKYKVAGDAIEDAVITHAGKQGGFVSLILQPPDRVTSNMITPKEMTFVIDSSGSMRGFPIEKAKQSMRMCIEGMNPNDTFNLVSFAGGLGYCFDRSVPNTRENRQKALDYLNNLEGSGGTEMMPAIQAALSGQDDERVRIVCFMTDGFIGNDMAILDAIQRNAGTARVFAFGIGSSVNRFLIEGMARAGRGASEVITLESDGDKAAERFHERIQNPLLTDISIDFGGLDVYDVYPDPDAIPDLFSAQPLVLTGRYRRGGDGVITVRGETSAGAFEREVRVSLPATEPENDVVASLWARQHVQRLMEQDWLGIQQGRPDTSIKKAITETGLEFSLVTQFTSFVAVEERVVTEGGRPRTVQVPVEMPDGVSYEGVFGASGDNFDYSAPMAQMKSLAVAAPSAAGSVEGVRMMERAKPEPPARQVQRKPMPNRAPAAADKDESLSKLSAELRNLPANAADGRYADGALTVRSGMVEVFVVLNDLNEDTLKTLKDLGAKVIAERRAGKTVHLSIRVSDLRKLAALEFVVSVKPPVF